VGNHILHAPLKLQLCKLVFFVIHKLKAFDIESNKIVLSVVIFSIRLDGALRHVK